MKALTRKKKPNHNKMKNKSMNAINDITRLDIVKKKKALNSQRKKPLSKKFQIFLSDLSLRFFRSEPSLSNPNLYLHNVD
jgi:hypothetical protein